jgi:hypothetical protein
MYQTEIKFFWPLTEQLPLDLNYKECDKPLLTAPTLSNQYLTINNGGTWTTGLVASHLNIDVDTTTVKLKEKPGLCRKTILKCLGLKWEIK